MKPASEAVKTLAECDLPQIGNFILSLRCYACGELIPMTAAAEEYQTTASRWIVATCPSCGLSTPFQLESVP